MDAPGGLSAGSILVRRGHQCGYVYSSELYSTIVICAVHSNYYLFIYGSSVDEPRSSECVVVRDVASGLVQLPGPQHGLGRAPWGGAGCKCGWYRAGSCPVVRRGEVSQWALSNNVLHADWLGMQLRFYEDSARDVVASGKAPTSL
jgi:hypothetical protein